jgi:hypothetical protein
MIGFAVVMLVLSLLITVLVQGVIAVLNLRGLNLLWGLKCLLRQISQREEAEVEQIAKAVLKHPSVSHASHRWWDALRYARAIRSDEIVRILMDLASRPGLKSAADGILADVGVRETSAWASMLEQELDKMLPADADKARLALDSAKERASGGRESFKEWYDTVMDRTSERFITHTRVITLVCAALLSFGLSIDAGYVFGRMHGDAALHAKLLQSSESTLKIAGDYQAKTTTSANADVLGPQIAELNATAHQIHERLDESDVLLTPAEPYKGYWKFRHVIGMIATMLLLSLGAPFWFNLLRQLANLRPLIANKVEKSEAGG